MKMRFLPFFTLCVFTPLVATAQPSQMQSPQDIARHIIELTKSGEQMNLKAVGSALDEPDLYNTAVFTSVGENSSYGNTYRPQNPKTPLKTIRHEIWLDMDSGFSKVNSAVEFEFKDGQCPSIADFERLSGNNAMAFNIPTSPDLITGKGGHYTTHYIDVSDTQKLSITQNGCRVSVYSQAKL